MKGTYTLLITVERPIEITVGALGDRQFAAGWYAYVGSAFGPGGFSRIDRHHSIATGDHDVRQWHIDYLLGAAGASIDTDYRSPEADIECALRDRVVGEPIKEFGASDCGCDSHLLYGPDRETLEESIKEAHEKLSA
ncbi:MAG: DUF123 domain-containing protein [Halobacteriales archaeon]